jgi:hypothetical protein
MKSSLAQGRATLATALSDAEAIQACTNAGITSLEAAGKSGAVALQGGASSATLQSADIALCSDGLTVHVGDARAAALRLFLRRVPLFCMFV